MLFELDFVFKFTNLTDQRARAVLSICSSLPTLIGFCFWNRNCPSLLWCLVGDRKLRREVSASCWFTTIPQTHTFFSWHAVGRSRPPWTCLGGLCFRRMCFFWGRQGHSWLSPSLSGLGKAQTFGAGDRCRLYLGESHVASTILNGGPCGSARWPHSLLTASRVTRGHVVCL